MAVCLIKISDNPQDKAKVSFYSRSWPNLDLEHTDTAEHLTTAQRLMLVMLGALRKAEAAGELKLG